MNTTIRISKNIREKLKLLGKKSQTYEEILKNIVEHVNSCETFWVNK